MDIPQQFRSKIGAYNIQIDDVKIKTTLINNQDVLDACLTELKSLIDKSLPVVGVDFKAPPMYNPRLLVLSVKNRCFVIQLTQLSPFPVSLARFLSDTTVCFVGHKIDSYFDTIRVNSAQHALMTGKGAEIRNLAAAILKNNSLTNCSGVRNLAEKSGLIQMNAAVVQITGSAEAYNAKYFSIEEMKSIIYEAYGCYLIGTKLLGML